MADEESGDKWPETLPYRVRIGLILYRLIGNGIGEQYMVQRRTERCRSGGKILAEELVTDARPHFPARSANQRLTEKDFVPAQVARQKRHFCIQVSGIENGGLRIAAGLFVDNFVDAKAAEFRLFFDFE